MHLFKLLLDKNKTLIDRQPPLTRKYRTDSMANRNSVLDCSPHKAPQRIELEEFRLENI